MANNSVRHHGGHMEHKIYKGHSGLQETRGAKVERDVPKISAMSRTQGVRGNPGAAGGTDMGNTAKSIPVAGPPKGRSNAEGDVD